MTNVLYQHGTLGTLMAGLLKGTASINELLQHGDLGIATLTGSNGEVIFLDGKAYHANEHKEFVELKGDELTPYATVTKFVADTSYETKDKSSEAVFAEIKEKMLSENLFSAVKISGLFKKMHVRMMPAQEPPYTRLIDSARRQPEQTETYVKGSVVGFFTPELFHGIGSAGFHVHFANDDRNFGGHVLDFEVEDVKVEIQNIETFEQHFPIHDEDFINANIDYKDIADEIREAE
ncbi:TPA: acetolactate decarboxylase [Staphylococcus aureus]|uniref:Alpha-acetolactate decarboxylase n=3 Tax=Staphylococcus aureus TaxID=1280 RepID=A0A0U1MRE6_STAAU|nr:acetolactate decarboxylase [Staphylococcus aureus]MBE5662105.1 acetolactate decarboxylase [Staphylococcus singaporensis]ALH97572.1 alpha-acetolactate decarboxylase [Staphylococcus aureus]EHM57537.1 alpha-acetolactate decarboxylase [Staphylococcus aureus subsp. aureus 21202]EHO90192.1 alpha-acetolactate decarboxylase [Staphylococcus aureus subsp. aureus 21252]EHT73470.1 alpha-acetolactate decarboxylase [Staphylococcus aureus subsp. aureus CIG290]